MGVMGVMGVRASWSWSFKSIHYEYYVYRKSGHLLSEVKHHLARLVLQRGTTFESSQVYCAAFFKHHQQRTCTQHYATTAFVQFLQKYPTKYHIHAIKASAMLLCSTWVGGVEESYSYRIYHAHDRRLFYFAVCSSLKLSLRIIAHSVAIVRYSGKIALSSRSTARWLQSGSLPIAWGT